MAFFVARSVGRVRVPGIFVAEGGAEIFGFGVASTGIAHSPFSVSKVPVTPLPIPFLARGVSRAASWEDAWQNT
jgi:hypothetical protein